jgi:hypothetical protein
MAEHGTSGAAARERTGRGDRRGERSGRFAGGTNGQRWEETRRARATDEAEAFLKLPGHEVGGALHIVLSDPNLENRHLAFCFVWAANGRCQCGAPRCNPAIDLCLTLIGLSMTQRKALRVELHRRAVDRFTLEATRLLLARLPEEERQKEGKLWSEQ